MSTKTNISKHLFRIILLLLFLPFLQSNLSLVSVGKLNGHVKLPSNATLTQKDWLLGNYQSQKENYLKYNFGFRNWAIRLDHQWAFWAYSKPKAWAVIGKDNYLFQPIYVHARNGRDFLGEQRVVELAKKVKEVQDTLNALGKAFVFAIAPSKVDYYPEFLFDKDQRKSEDVPTNYGILRREMIKNGTHFIDLNTWFLAMKDSTSYPLFPKTGIHYSDYGAALSANRIIEEVERQLGKDIPEYYWKDYNCTSNIRETETDLEDLLNLMFRIPNHKMCYPNYKINKKGKYRPRSITIGDSFFWQMYAMHMTYHVFKDGQFWLYTRDVHPGAKPMAKIDVGKALKKAEVIFILQTPGTMKRHLANFIEIIHNHYFRGENFILRHDDKIKEIIKSIKNNKPWLNSIKEKAKKRGIPLDEMLLKDARFLLKKQLAKKKKTK